MMSDIEKFNADISDRNVALDNIWARIQAATTTDEVSDAVSKLVEELNATIELGWRDSTWANSVFPVIERNTQIYNEAGKRMVELCGQQRGLS